ncbi:MAG: response regulator transcription factor [Clostridia bacterium]|nr:response regulator transcription factor [Clostridia bacterium]MBQ5905232.1 response regulator transcription factor [Clostridia bacterium]
MIYFLEDDASIQKLVCYALAKEGYEIKGLSLPSEFWKEIQEEIPELILLDIMLPEEDGISILKKLREDKKYQDIPVIMITAKTSEFDKVTGLDMGADDYITKPFGMTELASRVNAVLRRYKKTQVVNTKEFVLGNLYVNPEKHIIKLNGEDLVLSFKEYSLLLILLEADGKVVSREELLTKVWGEFYEESRTLDVHIRKLRVKLENSDVKIETVKNIGYKLGGADNEQ